MQGGPLFSGPPVVPPVGLEPTCIGSAHPAVIVGICRFSLAGVRVMRPRPFFQSLPVFTCFDRGLRFFVSKLCPNSMDARLKLPPRSSSYIYRIAGGGLSGHTRHWQQPPLDEFECAEQIPIDAHHVWICEHLVERPPCVGAPVWFDANIEFEMVEVIEFAFGLPVIDVD